MAPVTPGDLGAGVKSKGVKARQTSTETLNTPLG